VVEMENAELFEAGGEKGRGLRASRDLNAGEVVFSEPSYAAVVLDSVTSQVCHNCFRRQASLHSCAVCHFAHYCDRTCQTACWEEHRNECSAIRKRTSPPNHNVRLVARILWRMQKQTGIITDSQLVSVEALKDHQAELSQSELQNNIKHFLEFWPGKTQPEELVARLFAIIEVNSLTLSDQRGLQNVGLGLFPNLALVNHDCRPNCTVILNHGNQSAVNSALHSNRRVELRALEQIPEGAELTVSYVDLLQLSSDRQGALKQRYHFTCGCETCANHTKDDLMMAALDTAAAEKVKEVTAFSKESLEKMEAFRSAGSFLEVEQLSSELLSIQSEVLADSHLLTLRTLALGAEAAAVLHLFPLVAQYQARMIQGYRKLLHPNNGQLGLATMRAGVAHWHAGMIEAGHGMICKSYAILMVSHGPNHAVTRDLEVIRRQTEQELRIFNAAKNQPMSARH